MRLYAHCEAYKDYEEDQKVIEIVKQIQEKIMDVFGVEE